MASSILPRPRLRERAGASVIRSPGARNAGAPGPQNHPHPTLSRSTGRGNLIGGSVGNMDRCKTIIIALLAALIGPASAYATPAPATSGPAFFESKVRPVLVANC